MERVRKKGGARLEDAIQRAVFQHFKARRAPGVFAFHPKNGGIHQRGRRSGINAGLGVVSGVPDVIALKPDETGCQVFALELKAPGGTASPDQEQTLEAMQCAGATTGIAVGLDAAIRWLETHGLLVGRAA